MKRNRKLKLVTLDLDQYEDKIKLEAYHRYLYRIRSGILPQNEQERAWWEKADYAWAKKRIKNKLAKKIS